MAELANLIKQRGRIKAKLTAFGNFIDRLNEDPEKRKELKVRIEKAQGLWEEFDAIQNRIEDIQDSETQTLERSHFEDNYFKLIAAAQELQNERVPPAQTSRQTNQPLPQAEDNIG